MKEDASFCRELYQVLLRNPSAREYRLTFGPGNCCGDEHYLFDEDENLSETLCYKSTLLKVFRESHEFLTLFKSQSCKYKLCLILLFLNEYTNCAKSASSCKW